MTNVKAAEVAVVPPPSAVIASLVTSEGRPVGTLTMKARGYDGAPAFASGSKGFNGTGKLEVNGRAYQVSLNLVEIGTKAVKG